MHIILTGATGFLGGELLTQLISHPSITRITTLTRRPLIPATPKVQNIVLEDFSVYPPSVITQLSPADACIYTIGTYPGAKITPAEATKVNLTYALAAARAFATHPSTSLASKFNFIYTSGFLAERDPERKPWFNAEFRLMRGSIEAALLQLALEPSHRERFNVFIARPGYISAKVGLATAMTGMLLPKWMVIRVDELAACMIDVAVNGGDKQFLENAEMADRGRELLAKAT